MTLTTGIHGEQSVAVTNENTAKTMGSGTLDVFATPALVALAEKTCWTPTPRATRLHGPSTRFNVFFPEALASACSASNGFLMNNPIVL